MNRKMNILVSGADGNLGSAVVDKLLQEAHQVFALYANQEKADEDKRTLTKAVVDLMKAEAAKDAVLTMNENHGSIQAAVLTVGGFDFGTIADTTIEDIHEQLRLNFDTAFNLVKPLIANMKGDGHIFLIGARPATDPTELKDKLAYGLAKKLIFTLAEVINADRKDTGIQCSVVVPSIIDTPPNRENMPDADFSKWVTPEQIADAIYFHLTHGYVKEAVIKVYGEV